MLKLKFEVLTRIEHDFVLYLPAGTLNAPEKAVSVGRGGFITIPVDARGTIELSFEQSRPLLESGAIRRKS